MALNKDWRDSPDTTTPLSAAAIEDLEARANDEIILKIAAIARSSGSAAAATDALRRLGATAFDAAAGNDPRIPTQAENDALVGTSGAATAANRYVTNSDTRLSQPRQARVTRSTAQPIANASVVPIEFTTEDFDLPGNDQHNNVTNNNRLTCVEAGFYTIGASWTWALTGIAGIRIGYIFQGVAPLARDRRAGNEIEGTVTTGARLAVGEYVDFQVYQDSGVTGGLNLNSAAFWWIRHGA